MYFTKEGWLIDSHPRKILALGPRGSRSFLGLAGRVSAELRGFMQGGASGLGPEPRAVPQGEQKGSSQRAAATPGGMGDSLTQ